MEEKKNRFVLTRLLLRDVSLSQLLIYALGVFIGLFIIIVAFQFFRDINTTSEGDDDIFATSDFIVLSRKVDGLTFSSKNVDIQEELNEMQTLPWVKRAAGFIPAEFNVTGSMEFAGRGLTTYLFFESVPDDFFDELPEGWSFNPDQEDPVIPIILPRDYLALYNYGFAASRGLPKMGEDIFKELPITISISGAGKQKYLPAKIAGFSSRLNTIAVPLDFINWGNENFGKKNEIGEDSDEEYKGPQISRIIAEISVSPTDPQVREYLEAHGLELGGDKSLADSSNHVLVVIATVVIIIGLIIALLAIALLFISIFLLLHKTKAIIYRLLTLGYRPINISVIYTGLFACVNLVVLILGIIGLFIIESRFVTLLAEAGYPNTATIAPTILFAIAIVVVITVLCFGVFKRSISKS